MERAGETTPTQSINIEGLMEDQLKALFDSPLGQALRQHLWQLLENEVNRLHATGRRDAAHTAGGVMVAQKIVLPEKDDIWSAGSGA